MAQPPSPIRHALLEPMHIVGLLVALVALFVFDFATIALAIVTLLEVFYLFVFARTPAYARRVQLKLAQEAGANRENELALRAAKLNRDERRRYQAIDKLYQELTGQIDAMPDSGQLAVNRDQLFGLKATALEFCLALQNIREVTRKTSPDKLKEELRQLQSQPAPSGPAQEARRQTVELLEKRIQHFGEMEAQVPAVDAQLQVIEQTFRLLKEQLASLTTPARLPAAAEVTSLVQEVEATRRTLQEMGAFELEASSRLLS